MVLALHHCRERCRDHPCSFESPGSGAEDETEDRGRHDSRDRWFQPCWVQRLEQSVLSEQWGYHYTGERHSQHCWQHRCSGIQSEPRVSPGWTDPGVQEHDGRDAPDCPGRGRVRFRKHRAGIDEFALRGHGTQRDDECARHGVERHCDVVPLHHSPEYGGHHQRVRDERRWVEWGRDGIGWKRIGRRILIPRDRQGKGGRIAVSYPREQGAPD